jgi:hypothetical protein
MTDIPPPRPATVYEDALQRLGYQAIADEQGTPTTSTPPTVGSSIQPPTEQK